MTLRRPALADIEDISIRYGLDLTEAEVADLQPLIGAVMAGYDTLDQIPDPVRAVTPAVRIPGPRPEPEDDPLNGIVRTCSVEAAPPVPDGALGGKRIGLKDTVAIAGIPMSCASRLLYDYTPDIDATVTKRILEAGGHITAVLNTDDFAFSGGGHTSCYGPGRNPVDPAHVPGGSSNGSATAPATGQVDIALGGDQGGSIRIPASFSGVVGHKPTHGLVPYTGIVGFDQTIDHIGPMARTVEECARMLGVIAGVDDTAIDPRQPDTIAVPDYLGALTGDLKGLKVAVVTEGFETPEAMERVNKAVRAAIKQLEDLGAETAEVSVPMHRHVVPLWNCIAIEGGLDSFYHGHTAYQVKGYQNPRLISAMMRAVKTNAGDFSPTAKLGAVVGHYMREHYHGVFYARAQNLSRKLTSAYDAVLASADLVVMPTTPQTAHAMPAMPEENRGEHIGQALNMVHNTAAFDLTGHPSISVPVNGVDGLPVGLMLTGRHFEDATVLRAAHAYQRAG
ncbi:amidase [Marivibrio halodurans]|uniref:Amidase n=1 Tax=Marivibrio halodurans TaxID=2039722 RepID=A0A8J7SAE4_9PROT|nr:amidase [Marivibrio halodurans]MBP5858427.1 amidase [Marivibrio halodurans]